MIRLLLVLSMVLFVSCAPLPPQQTSAAAQRVSIGGVLTVDTVFDGDYLLEADLQIPAGITLTIKPGSTILVVPSDSTKIDPEYLSKETEIIIRGRLLALGTTAQPIRIYPAGDDQQQVLWAGLEFVASNDSRLENLLIEQAETAVLCLDSSPQLRYLKILRSRYGILLQQNSRPLIRDSQLADGEAGLFCWDQSAPVIERSSIIKHREEGLYLGGGCQATLDSNLIKQNDRGVVLPNNVTIDSSNLVFDNRINLQSYQAGGTQ